MKPIIAPSILSADFAYLAKDRITASSFFVSNKEMASADVTPPEDDDFLISESDAQAFATILTFPQMD